MRGGLPCSPPFLRLPPEHPPCIRPDGQLEVLPRLPYALPVMHMPRVTYRSPAGLAGVELLSCPHMDVAFPPHVHDTLTIWVNDCGGEYFRFKGNTSVLDLDGFGVVNAGEVHANGGVGDGARHLKTFYIDMSLLESLVGRGYGALSDGLHVDATMHARLTRVHDALCSSEDPLVSQTLFVETFSALLQRHGEQGGAASQSVGRDALRFRQLRDRLCDSLDGRVTLDMLASEAGCSPQHVIRIFRAHAGISPHAYLVRLRIARVRRLLREGMSVNDAAHACGFADQSHCSRWFRTLTGTTPAIYRRSVQPEPVSDHS